MTFYTPLERLAKSAKECGMNYGMCGRWRNGRLASVCTMAGSEECDFECPYRDAPDDSDAALRAALGTQPVKEQSRG